jgi:hypothetical protein
MAKALRRRRRWLWLGVLPALVLLGVFGVRALLQPDRLSAFLLRQASQATGLQLTLSEPAGVGLWPDLHLALSGLAASAPGAGSPMLRAGRVEAVLPWSALYSDTLQIRSLRLVAPELDWAALQGWLATRESSGAPFSLPRIDAAVEVSEGRVTGEGWSLEALSLHLPALREGEKTTLALGFMLVRATPETVHGEPVESAAPVRGKPVEPAATVREPVEPLPRRFGPYELVLSGTPRTSPDGLRLDDLAIELHGISDAPIAITGSTAWMRDAGFSISLAGELPGWPAEWPALPLPPADAPVTLGLSYTPSQFSLALERADDAIEASFALGDIGAWMDDPAAPLLPQLTGSAHAERLQFGTVELRGVKLRIDDEAPPKATQPSE